MIIRLFSLNFVSFFLIVANTRAYTQGQYLWTAVTDMTLCLLSAVIFKGLSEVTTWRPRIAYAIGGTAGAQFAIFITKLVYGA